MFNDLIKSYCPAAFKLCFIAPLNCRPKNHKAEHPDELLPPTRQSDWTPTNGRNSKSCHLQRVGRSPVGHHQFLLRERERPSTSFQVTGAFMSTESSQISPLYRIDYQNYITLLDAWETDSSTVKVLISTHNWEIDAKSPRTYNTTHI